MTGAVTAHAFTYGSLMWADIMARVCGHEFAGEPATLAGHRRHPVRGQDYPGVCIDAAGSVPGKLYRDVTADAWKRLDLFEGEQYERVGVVVALADGRTLPAQVYRFRDEFLERLAPGEWSTAAFEREGRARFIARYAGFDLVAPR